MMRYFYTLGISAIIVALIGGFGTGAIIRDSDPIDHRGVRPSVSSTSTIKTTTSNQSVKTIVPLTGTLFASPKASYDPRRAIIDTATGHMDVRMYDVTYNRAKLPIVQLAEAGLPMRWILEDKKYSSFGNSYVGTKALFSDVGIKILSDSDLGLGTNYVHAKTFVTDDRAMIETANLTKGGFETSREYYVQLKDQAIIDNLQALFDADRAGKPLTADMIHSNLLVCPINCRAIIESLIKGATSSIWIQNQYLEDPQLTQLISNKLKSTTGLDLQMVLAKNDFATGTLDKFANRISIVTSPYPHAKMMLIDDRYLMVSSINYSTNSIDNNREIGVIVTNREAIDYFKERFLLDRAKGKNLPQNQKTKKKS